MSKLDKDTIKKLNSYFYSKDFTRNKQILRFMAWCGSHGFFDRFSEDEIDMIIRSEYVTLPILSNNGISIGVEHYKGKWKTVFRVGIDPENKFSDISNCSIIIHFPVRSDSDIESTYKLLNMLMDRDCFESKLWFKNASRYRNGGYFSN